MSDCGNAFVIECADDARVFVFERQGTLRFSITDDSGPVGYFALTEATARKLVPFMQAWLGKCADKKESP